MSTFGSGWLPLRRGWMEHIADGRVTVAEYVAFISMLLLADARTGRWRGSARALTTLLNYGSKNTMADALEGLETKGYILRDFTPGARGNFPIIIDKFQITNGPDAGKRVDLAATKRKYGIPDGSLSKLKRKSLLSAISAACKNPVFESETDQGHEAGEEIGYDAGAGGGSVSRIENIEDRRDKRIESERESDSFASILGGSGNKKSPVSDSSSVPSQDPDQSLIPVTGKTSAPSCPTFPAEANAETPAAVRLAIQFFEYQGRPAKLNTLEVLGQWTALFEQMIPVHGLADLEGALQWAFEIDGFWPTKLVRSKEPLTYFMQKLDEQIMPRFRAWRTAQKKRANKSTTTTTERIAPKASASGQSLVNKWGGKLNG
jgi:hypothetical protein